MNALIITMSTNTGIVVGAALIIAGILIMQGCQLWADDRRDVKAQAVEDDRDAILDATTGPVQHADDPARRGRRIVIPAQRDGSAS